MDKLRVGVLMGGKSIEREVSFNSGRTVCDHLDTFLYNVVPIFQKSNGQLFILPWHFLHRGKICDFERRLKNEGQEIKWDNLQHIVDFIYIAMHGNYAEDGCLQGFLEILGIPYLGTKIFGSALGMDKIVQKEILSMHGITVPTGIAVTPEEIRNYDQCNKSIFEKLKATSIEPPYIIKPYKEGSSLGVSVVFSREKLQKALEKACFINKTKPQQVLIEEKIDGMEFSCIVITNYKTGNLLPLPPTEIVHEQGTHFHDYEQKYMPGKAMKFTPARAPEKTIKKIQTICVATTRALEFSNISRIDGFLTCDNRVVVVDPNSLSGMAPSSFLFREAAEINMNHTQVINHLIKTELNQCDTLSPINIYKERRGKKVPRQRLRVAILMGGNTNEREISLESGRNITYKLSPHKYKAIPLFVTKSMELYKLNQSQLVRYSTKEIEKLLDQKSKIAWHDLPTIADFVFIGLHGGAGENGAIQGTLEMLDLPYNGSSVLTSALCSNKYKTTQFLKYKGFEVPKAQLISKINWENNKNDIKKEIITSIGLPLIVKPHDDGCSIGVQKVKKESGLDQAIDNLFKLGKIHAMVEECIGGMELTVAVIGNATPQALPPSQAVTTSDVLTIEEKFLPGAGENQTPAPLPRKSIKYVQKTMEAIYATLGCKGYARIDCFYQSSKQSPTGKERVIFLELNSLPGMTPATCIFHQAAEIGIRPMDFIDKIIDYGLEEHVHRSKSFATFKKKEKNKNV